MTVKEMADTLGFKIFSEGDLDRDVRGGYIGDLLSWIMGRAGEDSAWITIMSNVNVAAVAMLADVSCVILAEGVAPDDALKTKAEAGEITLLGSEKNAYDIACAMCKAGI